MVFLTFTWLIAIFSASLDNRKKSNISIGQRDWWGFTHHLMGTNMTRVERQEMSREPGWEVFDVETGNHWWTGLPHTFTHSPNSNICMSCSIYSTHIRTIVVGSHTNLQKCWTTGDARQSKNHEPTKTKILGSSSGSTSVGTCTARVQSVLLYQWCVFPHPSPPHTTISTRWCPFIGIPVWIPLSVKQSRPINASPSTPSALHAWHM